MALRGTFRPWQTRCLSLLVTLDGHTFVDTELRERLASHRAAYRQLTRQRLAKVVHLRAVAYKVADRIASEASEAGSLKRRRSLLEAHGCAWAAQHCGGCSLCQ